MDRASAIDTVDAAFETFGEEANYSAPESVEDPTPCVVIPWVPSGERDRSGIKVSDFDIAERSTFMLVRAAEIAEPMAGGAFVMEETGQVWRIGEDAPIPHDTHRLVWRCRAVLEQG